MTNRMKMVTLVGCGNIGFRHLQALVAMDAPAKITIVEPAAAARARIKVLATESAETGHAQGGHEFHILSSTAELPLHESDLAVIATDTRHRRAAWEALRARQRPKAVIFEKVLFPTLGDVEAVASDLTKAQIAGFVNCGRRGFPDYQSLARRFGGTGTPVDVTVEGSRFGLGSNAVHFLDLAEMLNGAALVSLSAEALNPGSQASKRPGYVEIFGTLRGELSNGAKISINCADSEPVSVRVNLAGQDGSRILIDEFAAIWREADEEKSFSIRYVSQMHELYDSLLENCSSVLTPYVDSARQHRFYLQALRDHLGLSNAEDEPCPVS